MRPVRPVPVSAVWLCNVVRSGIRCRTVQGFAGRCGQLAGPVSASQWLLRDFWAFRCCIDAFVCKRVWTVCKGVRKRVNLFFRVVWIGLGLRIGCRGYRNDVPHIVVVIVVFDLNNKI